MPYEPLTWVDYDPDYPLSAARLIHLDFGIRDAHSAAAAAANTGGNAAAAAGEAAGAAATADEKAVTALAVINGRLSDANIGIKIGAAQDARDAAYRKLSGGVLFGPKALITERVLRQPWTSKQELRASDGPGEASDHVAHVVVSEAIGSWVADTGPSARQGFGLNVYSVTGKGATDGDGMNVLYGALIESSLRSPANMNLLTGLQAETSLSGDQAKGRVAQMRSLAVANPNRKDGFASEGSAGTAIGLYINGVPLGKNQGNPDHWADYTYSLYSAGGTHLFNGRTDFVPTSTDTAALVVKGFGSGGPGQTVAAIQAADGTTNIKFLAGGTIAAKSNIVANEGGGSGVKIGNYGPAGEAAVQFGTVGNLLTLYLSGGALMVKYNALAAKTVTVV